MRRKRIFAFLLAFLLFFASPVSDYLYVRDTYALGMSVTAVEYVFDVLFHAAGVNALENTNSLIADMENWVKINPAANLKYLVAFETLKKAAWGTVLHVGQEAIDMVRDYFRGKGDYGKGDGLGGIPISNTDYISYSDSFCSSMGINPGDYGIDSSNYLMSSYRLNIDVCDYFIPVEYANDNYRMLATSGDSLGSNRYITMYAYDIVNDAVERIDLDCLVIEIDNNPPLVKKGVSSPYCNVPHEAVGRYNGWEDVIMALPFPFLKTTSLPADYILNWVHNPIIYKTFNDWPIGVNGEIWDGVSPTVTVPVKSLPDIQARPITAAPDIVLPESDAEAQERKKSLAAATTPDEMAAALAPTLEVTYGEPTDNPDEGEKDNPFLPLLPDLTKLFDGLKAGIDSLGVILNDIKSFVTDIPQKLNDLYDFLLSIPEIWVRFWSVDWPAVHVELSALNAAFQSKFTPLVVITDIFGNAHAMMNDQIPVIKMGVPPDLAPYVGGDEIIVFDLRGYEGYVDKIRLLFQCSMWLSFAIWMIYSVKFDFGID